MYSAASFSYSGCCMRFTWFGLYCGLMLSISAFSTDILLPAVLDMSLDLGVPAQQIQLAVPAYMLGLGLAHPLFGVLADRIGRRRAIFIGLALYMVGTVVVALSSQITAILGARVIQGFGAAAAPVVCRAMIRDRFRGDELAQNMAIASMFFALGPMIAPLLGYLINELAGWRALFGFLFAFCVLMIWATAKQPETLAPEHRRRTGWFGIYQDATAIFRDRQSRYFIFASAICSATIISFLTQAPIVYERDLGASSSLFATLFALSAIGIIVGQIIYHRLIALIGVLPSALLASTVIAVTAAVILVASLTHSLSLAGLSALMFVFNMAYLIVYSNFVSLALDPHGERAGLAAALFGLISYIGGAAFAATIAWLSGGHLIGWSIGFVTLGILMFCSALYWQRRARVVNS